MLPPDQLATLNISLFEQMHELARTRMKEVMNLTTLGLRSITLLSGGAIVSLFTLLGHTENLVVNGSLLWLAFAGFAASLSFTMAATLLSFFSQNDFLQYEFSITWKLYLEISTQTQRPDIEKKVRYGKWTRVAAIVCAVLALFGFIAGGFASLASIRLIDHSQSIAIPNSPVLPALKSHSR